MRDEQRSQHRPSDGRAGSGRRQLSVLGIRGIPAAHGGFETFAARLAPWLVSRGWDITVYCQVDEIGEPHVTWWQGVRLVHIGVGPDTAVNSMRFDWACIRHVIKERAPLVLTLGYNTALFGARLRLAGVKQVINMDGIEWSRAKWGRLARAWLYLNDWGGCLLADHLLADHPHIARHLSTRVSMSRISMIPYGTDRIDDGDVGVLSAYGLQPGGYVTLIARPEPENSVLDIVQAFSARRRGVKLVVLGNYHPDVIPFHAEVLAAASDEVQFVGGIYEPERVAALRLHSLLYVHGHRVGGTNPSLLEAMGAGNAVLAHDNRFNRWVVGEGAAYFNGREQAAEELDDLLNNPARRAQLAAHNRQRAATTFAWPRVLESYEQVLAAWHARAIGQAHVSLPAWTGRPEGNQGADS